MAYLSDLDHITIEPAAIALMPKSMARDLPVLAVAIIDKTLHVILPTDADQKLISDRLEFILNRKIEVDTTDRQQLEAAIERYYPRELDDPPLPDSLPELDSRGEFQFLDLTGEISCSTSSSVSFNVGRKSDYVENDNGERTFLGKRRVFHVFGWLDVHYPCHQFHKLMIRCVLPDDYIHFDSICDLVVCVKTALKLPDHVSWSISAHSSSNSLSMDHPQNTFICDTKWIPPGSS